MLFLIINIQESEYSIFFSDFQAKCQTHNNFLCNNT